MISKRDSGLTGNFEVSVGDTLVYSKKKGDGGKLEKDSERLIVINAITKALEPKDKDEDEKETK